MAGRFPLYTDADVNGPVVDALKDRRWDVVRAIDTFAEGTDDDVHFAHAAREGRVMVANDIDSSSWPSAGTGSNGPSQGSCGGRGNTTRA